MRLKFKPTEFFNSAITEGTKAKTGGPDSSSYSNVSQKDAKEIMKSGKKFTVLDVRTKEEYDDGHIPGAVLIPDYEIAENAEKILKDKNELIFVYCRTGVRSLRSSSRLVKLGYKNIADIGGILSWPYEIEK